MKRIFAMSAAVLSLLVFVTGCSEKESSEPSAQESIAAEDVSQTETESLTEPTEAQPVRNITKAEGTYIYDNAKLLSQADFDECNNYAEWLYENYLINTAVVTADNLGGASPEEYAENVYTDLYGGKGSGLVLLINNDTNEDYLYKKGSCSTQIPEDKQAEEFYFATQELVSGDCKGAVLRMLRLGEYCSQYVFDNAGVFTGELASELEAMCADSKKNITVLATYNGTQASGEEICRSYYERRYKESSGIMIMLDTAIPDIIVYSENPLPQNIDNIISEAETCFETDGYHPGGYHSAIRYIITQLEGA